MRHRRGDSVSKKAESWVMGPPGRKELEEAKNGFSPGAPQKEHSLTDTSMSNSYTPEL